MKKECIAVAGGWQLSWSEIHLHLLAWLRDPFNVWRAFHFLVSLVGTNN